MAAGTHVYIPSSLLSASHTVLYRAFSLFLMSWTLRGAYHVLDSDCITDTFLGRLTLSFIAFVSYIAAVLCIFPRFPPPFAHCVCFAFMLGMLSHRFAFCPWPRFPQYNRPSTSVTRSASLSSLTPTCFLYNCPYQSPRLYQCQVVSSHARLIAKG